MKIRLVPYALPLVRPWVASSAVLPVRQGRLLILEEDGLQGIGDCAPLPSSGPVGHERVFSALEKAAASQDWQSTDCPEVHWAVETALADLKAKQAGLPLYRFLGGETNLVSVNAALGPLDDGCAARAQAAAEQGFTLAKIKVGLAAPEIELERLRALSHVGLRLRLDANRAWNESQASRILHALADLPIDGVEEPLAYPTPERLAALQAAVPFPIAVDESLPQFGLEAFLKAKSMRRLVLKPARIGGITATRRLAEQAQAQGIEVVLTSVVDSSVGVTACAHLASALCPKATHGLATLSWLQQDVALPPTVANGQFVLPDGNGLGLSLLGEVA